MTVEPLVVPPNPARALHEILKEVTSSRSGSVKESWASALGADAGSSGFIRRHAEVVSLFATVQIFLESGADAELSEVYARYLPSWYAVICPASDWANTHPSHLIASDVLTHLHGLAIALRSNSTPWTAAHDVQMRSLLEKWREVLDGDLPEHAAAQLRVRFSHLSWLVDSINLFGAGPVNRATGELATAGIQAASKPFGAKAKAAMASAMAATILYLGMAEDITGEANAVLENLNGIVTQVEQLTRHERPALPAPPPQQLEAGDREHRGGE